MERPKTKYHYDNNKSSLCCFSQRQVQKGKKHTPHVCSDKNSIVIEKVELIIICDYRAFMNNEQHCHRMSAIYKNILNLIMKLQSIKALSFHDMKLM